MKISENKRLKIVVLADALDNQTAGVHQYTFSFLQALNQLETHHEIVVLREKEDNYSWQNLRTVVIPSPSNPIEKAIRIFYQIPKKVNEIGADLVIEMAHFGPFNLPSRIKRTVFIHDLTPILFPAYHVAQSSWLQKMFLPRIFSKVECVFVNSNYTKRDCLKHYPEIKTIKVLRPGYDPRFYPDQGRVEFPNDYLTNPYILAVGTLEPRKNLIVLIQAFEKLKAEGWVGQLVLTGSKGWKNKSLELKIDKSPYRSDIHQTGFVEIDDLRKLYSQCAVFVYPSFYEGFGLPILEALSCGAKVISSGTSSMPEVGDKFASYFDPNNPTELLRKIKARLEEKSFDVEPQISYAKKHMWKHAGLAFIDVVEGICWNKNVKND